MSAARTRHVLTVNGGSSSVKFALFAATSPLPRIFSGKIERIGLPRAIFTVRGQAPAENFYRIVAAPTQAAAAKILVRWLRERLPDAELAGIGHRFVHGGPAFHEPRRITRALVAQLGKISAFDPEHLPAELGLAAALQQAFPQVPQIACFDTAFHRGMPDVARRLPIPHKLAAKGAQRYGFHGLSYEYLLGELTRVAGRRAARGRVILAHLGNGASLAAVHHGRPVDTSMGLTPAAGVPMGTRSGDLDPGLVWYLARTEGMSAREFNHLVNFESGLLGVSGLSSDLRDLLRAAPRHPRAAEAVELFCYQLKKFIGAYAAALGGLDTLVFAGGIGEHLPAIRARICDNLAYLGIKLAARKNRANAGIISTRAGRVTVRVMRTDEEWIIAKKTRDHLRLPPAAGPSHESKKRN